MVDSQTEVATGSDGPFNLAAMVQVEEGRAPPLASGDSDAGNHDYPPTQSLLHPDQLEEGPLIKVTLWRLLNTVLLLGLGVYKAVAAYRGQQTAPTTLDWILGVLWAVIAYWTSFLEDARLGPRGHWFFAEDHSSIALSILIYSSVVSISFGAAAYLWYGVLGMNWIGFWIGPLWLVACYLALTCKGARAESSYRHRRSRYGLRVAP
ncbi:hypothetical protein C8R45DRAFT_965009 [Mycena sanguinolenta]|nr:hypothetical protein C8R45DRAFT_965009 [Mycena sanguinolenta]